jgi:hypothetical protein
MEQGHEKSILQHPEEVQLTSPSRTVNDPLRVMLPAERDGIYKTSLMDVYTGRKRSFYHRY